MTYDYSKLNGRIIEVCGTSKTFAKLMGLSERTVSLKLSNKRSFKQSDIEKAKDILNLKGKDIDQYFFTKKVHSQWTKTQKKKAYYEASQYKLQSKTIY